METINKEKYVETAFDFYNEQSDKMGMRLEKFQMFNWGAYEGVWTFDPKRSNCLITGNSGSGKSTLVDGLLTLFIDPRKIAYNQAAEQNRRRGKRTKAKYILGNYDAQNERKRLRDKNSKSVLLAVFSDHYGKTCTLALITWLPGTSITPKNVYIISQKKLDIEKDFSELENMNRLEYNLNLISDTHIFYDYGSYERSLTTMLGFRDESSLLLWQQATSLKEVEDIDKFIKEKMLQKVDLEQECLEAGQQMRSYNSMKDSIKKYREKEELLNTIIESGDNFFNAAKTLDKLNNLFDEIENWKYINIGESAKEKKVRTEERMKNLTEKENEENRRKSELEKEREQLVKDIDSNGGQNLQVLKNKRYNNSLKITEVELRKKNFDQKVKELKELPVNSKEQFWNLKDRIPDIIRSADARKQEVEAKKNENYLKLNELQTEYEKNKSTIAFMETHPTNIPIEYAKQRDEMCKALNISKDEMPYAGELIQVSKDGKDKGWQDAIERVMRPFALRILVKGKYEKEVNHYVNSHQYTEQPMKYTIIRNLNEEVKEPEDISRPYLFNYIDYNEVSEFYNWVRKQMMERFDYICTDDPEEFKKESFAVTRKGLIKQSGNRHEKNDRSERNTKDRYILGFQNKEKLEALKKEADEQLKKLNKLMEARKVMIETIKNCGIIKQAGEAILTYYSNYSDIDVDPYFEEEKSLSEKIKLLEAKQPILNKLMRDKEIVEKEIAITESKIRKVVEEEVREKNRIEAYERYIEMENIVKEDLNKRNIDYRNLDLEYNEIKTRISHLKRNKMPVSTDDDYWEQTAKNIGNKIREDIGGVETKRDNSLEEYQKKAGGYIKKYNKQGILSIELDCLKEYKNEQEETKNSIAILVDKLSGGNLDDSYRTNVKTSFLKIYNDIKQQVKEDRDKIDDLNKILETLEIQKGKKLRIKYDDSDDLRIKNFRKQLQGLAGFFVDHDLDAPTLENQVKLEKDMEKYDSTIRDFIEMKEDDTRRRRVKEETDARAWTKFTVEIEDKKTGEVQTYKDTSILSGGEKERMAYTILGAAFIYNFNLDTVGETGRSFRTIIIDEAFQKSDDSIRRTILKMLNELHLQVILITPFDNIEPYTKYVDRVCKIFSTRDEEKEANTSTLAMYHYKDGIFRKVKEEEN